MSSGSSKETPKVEPVTRQLVAQDAVSRKRHFDHGGEMTKTHHNRHNGKHGRKGKQDRRKQNRNQPKGNHALRQPEAKASEVPQDKPPTLPQLEVKGSEDSCSQDGPPSQLNHDLPQPEVNASEGPQDEPLTLPQPEVKALEGPCTRDTELPSQLAASEPASGLQNDLQSLPRHFVATQPSNPSDLPSVPLIQLSDPSVQPSEPLFRPSNTANHTAQTLNPLELLGIACNQPNTPSTPSCNIPIESCTTLPQASGSPASLFGCTDNEPVYPLQFLTPVGYLQRYDYPPYTGMDPFKPRTVQQRGDSKPFDHCDGSLELLDKSVKEMSDGKYIFNGLIEGIERQHRIWLMDAVEKDIYDAVFTLETQSDSVLRSCSALRKSTRIFIENFEEKLRNIAPSVSGTILSDEGLKKNGDELIRASLVMSDHVTIMLQKLKGLVTFVQSTKHRSNSSLWKKLSSMALRAAGHKKEENLGTVLEFLQTHILEAAESAERKLKMFLGLHGAFRSPLGVGTVGGIVWMDGKQATRARDEMVPNFVEFI